MKLSELPVYWDLFRLPLPVVLKRVRHRLIGAKDVYVSYNIPASLKCRSGIFDISIPKLQKTEKSNILIDHYLKDELNLVGSGWTSLRNDSAPKGFQEKSYGKFPRKELAEKSIDWNRDQRTGYQFEINGNSGEQLRKAFATKGVDVKFSWEFARMHYLPQLALAYHAYVDKQGDIIEVFKAHIESFAEQCESGKGIHWTSPMEAAVRITNILVGFQWLKDQLPGFDEVVLKLAYSHYQYVSNHLEHKDGFGTNHYLSNLMGLVVLGHFLDDKDVSEKSLWAWSEFEKELQKQFLVDGFNFEYSTYYHRLSTEIALVTMRFASKQSFEIKPSTNKIVGKALASMEALMKPNGELPKFGDIDSGRILDLDPEGNLLQNDFEPCAERCGFIKELRTPVSIYNWFYGDVISKLQNHSVSTLMPKAAVNRTKRELSHSSEWKLKFPEVNLDKIEHYHWPESGLVVYKSDEFYLGINLMASKKGHRYRGHMHNDKGSFELWAHGTNYISDPGVVSYTASVELRNLYRQTSAHPIPYTGVEQNRYLAGFLGLFHTCLDVEARVVKMTDHSLECEVFYQGVKHFRRFEIKNDRLLVMDWCNQPFTINKNTEIPLTAGYGKLQ